MSVDTFEVQRFRLTSAKPFDAVVASIKSAIGQPDITAFFEATRGAASLVELERIVKAEVGRTSLILFAEFDLGAILRCEAGANAPRSTRLVVGNPLIMKEMVKHVPDAGSYAPVTILIDERAAGVHLSYDRMESYLQPYGNAEALTVARGLDTKIIGLLRECAS